MIETERLRIRNFVSEDSKSCFESWGKDKDLGKYIGPKGFHFIDAGISQYCGCN